MAYTPQTWVDGAAGGTPLSAARLGTLENAVGSAHEALDLKAAEGGNIAAAQISSGLLALARLPVGAAFTIRWTGTAWATLDGATITARPTTRTDLTMIAMGGTTAPAFGIVNKDLWLKDTV